MRSRVDAVSISINGAAVELDESYRITVNSLLAEGAEKVGGDIGPDALIVYFANNGPLRPGPQDRIMRLN